MRGKGLLLLSSAVVAFTLLYVNADFEVGLVKKEGTDLLPNSKGNTMLEISNGELVRVSSGTLAECIQLMEGSGCTLSVDRVDEGCLDIILAKEDTVIRLLYNKANGGLASFSKPYEEKYDFATYISESIEK